MSLYLNPNQIVGRKDLKISKIEVPELPKISERKEFSEYTIQSPLGEKELIASPKGQAQVPKVQEEIFPPKVTMLYKGRDAYALFGDEIRRERESIGDFVVERISSDRCFFEQRKGEKKYG